jgi:hypothetical protein
MTKIMNDKYAGQGSAREHIMMFFAMSNKLKDLEMPLPIPTFTTTLCCLSHKVFDNFKFNYNGNDKKWSLTELIVKCSQEEERLRAEHEDFVNLISQGFNIGLFGEKRSQIHRTRATIRMRNRPMVAVPDQSRHIKWGGWRHIGLTLPSLPAPPLHFLTRSAGLAFATI